ncbi:MAG: PRC-barrel domain-containing protein [Actinomycetota bacterium]|nr:PRC-barrel domain-containing protein [Actinomycetota bacterium]MDP9475281.1 PRC-barrel domain-containing protein [Actinomycetota bacterium]MDP9484333.1 PRC-barrel domain-containing protein [Actinomycetota bacterium]
MERERRPEAFTTTDDRFAGYTVYDRAGEKIGKVDDLFVDEDDQPEYIGVKIGFLGTRSTLIPFSIATVDDERQSVTVSTDKETAKDGPSFDDDREITPEFEGEVYSYYGAQRTSGTEERGAYGEETGGGTHAAAAGHVLLGDLAEGELAAMAGRQAISPAARGSGLSDVSRDHDRYLAEG